MLEVIEPGFLTTPQDRGRPGHAHLGIGQAGAADRVALTLANALVGNPADACALEITLNGPVLEAHGDCHVALAGAPMPHARINEDPLPMGTPRRLPAGSRLTTGGMPTGCRSYLAVAGGFDVAPWLGSRCRDVNADLGPAALAAGAELPVGQPTMALADRYPWGADVSPWRQPQPLCLRILPGHHTHLLDADSSRALAEQEYTLSSDSNRVACRLDGTSLQLRDDIEVVTTGTVNGSIQLPPGGQPIVFGCEHPVSGGYPRIGQLIEADIPRLAQCRPGDRIRLRWVTLQAAFDARREQQQLIRQVSGQIRQRLEDGE